MPSSLMIYIRLHQPLEKADVQLQLPCHTTPDDGAQLFRIATQDHIRLQIRHSLDGNHGFRLGCLTGLIYKDMTEVTTWDSDVVREGGRHASRDNNPESPKYRPWWERIVAIEVFVSEVG